MEVDMDQSDQDPGLYLLIPLYRLLRGNCTQTIIKIVVTKFQNCTFFYENEDRDKHYDYNMYEFLKSMHTKGTNRQKKVKKQSNQGKQKQERSWQINNLRDNEEILRTITVKNMLAADEEKCKPLKDLDLNFLLNIVTNAILLYPFSENDNTLKSINEVKEIRNGLYHAKYNFSVADFNRNLEMLQKALKEIYKVFGIPQHILDKQIEECIRETTVPNPQSYYLEIFEALRMEIHDKYKSPENFVCPTIKEACDGEEPYVESLDFYLRDHNSKPILLCGKRGSGKTSILQDQAYQLVKKIKAAENQGDQPQFSLVILFEENAHGPLKKEKFWENVANSLKNLAPNTAERHDIQTLLVVIKIHIKETIFLINWNLQDTPPQFQETSNGTWVFTYHGIPVKSADWNILIAEPLKDTQVYKLLESLNPDRHKQEIIQEKYRACNYKDILITPDLVKIFNELNINSGSGTEFELMIKYVKKKMDEGNHSNKVITYNNIRAVGKLCFYGIRKNKQQFRIEEVEKEKEITEPVQLAFFTKNRNYFELIHNTLMDFLASVYVIEDLDQACKEWLKDTSIFKRVFKFACSFWFRDVDHCWKETVKKNGNKKDYLKKMEDFLCKFLSIEKCKTERTQDHKTNKMNGSSSTMEVDVNNPDNNTNDSMEVDVSGKEVSEKGVSEKEDREMLMSGNPVKNPFSKWGFLIHIDEACDGESEVLEMLANLLSYIKCWVFKCKLLDESKMKGVQKILKNVKLSQSSDVTIKIESGPSCNMLIKIWDILKKTESLYNTVKVRISILHEKKGGKYHILDDRSLKDLPRVIVNTRAPVYITELNMPVISPKITDFKFSMCECIQKLEYLDVLVYDVNSLREVLVCGNLPNMKSIKIYVDLKVSEKKIVNLPQLKIPNPKNINVNVTIVYFEEIQKLLDAFTGRHRLLSLSIRGIVINEGFRLDISAFTNMESLYLHCDINYNDSHEHYNCALLLSVNLILPKHLERLLLSKVQFYNDTNIHLFRNFFAKYNIQRLMILDSNLSLDGARTVLKQQMFQEKETDLDLELNKKMKIDRSDSPDLNKMVAKKPRLPKKLREEKQKDKPKGKEIIITSNTELGCNLEPCQCGTQCTTILNPSEVLKNILESLSALIEDTYCYSILSFAFNNKSIIVHKNLCNDLRVHCPLFKIQDNDMYQIQQNKIPSNSPILQLFQSLTLIQSLYIEKTALSYVGIMRFVTVMKTYKRKLCQDNLVEPFSLTVTSDNLPCGDGHEINSGVRNSQPFEDLKKESCLQMLNIWCTCNNRCHKLKKTHDGDIYLNDTLEHRALKRN